MTTTKGETTGGIVEMPILRKFMYVLKPFFTFNKDRVKAWGWLVAMIILLMLESAFLVTFSYTQRDFSTAMSSKDEAGFYRGTRRYLALLVAASPLFAFSKFVQGKLALDWRRWLTDHLLSSYFSNRAYFALKMGVHFEPGNKAGNSKDPLEAKGGCQGEEQGGCIDNPVSMVDNPDQRIGEDISSFTQNCISVIVVLVGSVLKMASFVGVLLSISPNLTAFVVAYSLAGTVITTSFFGAQLKHFVFEGAKREANFRFALVRVREHAEEIAFYRGEKKEYNAVQQLLDKVLTNTHLKLWCEAKLAVVQNSFMWLTTVLPYLVIAHRHFAGEIEFGVISQTAMAFRVIQNALSVIVTQIKTLASLASEVDRLHFLLVIVDGIRDDELPADGEGAGGQRSSAPGKEAVGAEVTVDDFVAVPGDSPDGEKDDENNSGDNDDGTSNFDLIEDHDTHDGSAIRLLDGDEWSKGPRAVGSCAETSGRIRTKTFTTDASEKGIPREGGVVQPSATLEVKDLTLFTPDYKSSICRHLSLRVQPGQSILIFGPSGCGKSSLLRAISGLWTTGTGCVRRPTDEESMFIPQKPYFPLGSLRAQMLYPKSEDERYLTDSALESVLEEVQLGYLSGRYGGLDARRDWKDELSIGEQQRLGFSRLLTNTPSMVFLDESTSALDEANEAALYRWVQNAGIEAFISVGHRASLFRYHTHVLRGQTDGEWSLHTMKDFLEHHYSPTPRD